MTLNTIKNLLFGKLFLVHYGVQNNKNRVRGLRLGNIYAYLASGLIFTILFIFCGITVNEVVLSSTGI